MIKPGMFISDRYEIIDKVGSGGMADVYKAKCHRLNRFVAIKILKPEFSNDKSFVNKFRGEAQSAAGLSHPNVVNVYDVGDDDGLHYIVMELVEGITLKKFIERKGKLEIKEAIGIAIQIAQGMEAAHGNHIIHRDIKPQNIIISKEGKVKVTDFGIAKATTSNTITSNAMGSVHYLSPEQARGGYSDEKSDIYSLGVTLYEMLSGQVPFAGDNNVSVALLHIQGEATPLRELNPNIPNSIDLIVQKCMQKKPERRYLTASELIVDLKKAITNPNGDFVKLAAPIVTDSPTINLPASDVNRIKSEAGLKSRVEEDDEVTSDTTILPREEEEGLDDVDPRIAKILSILMIVIGIVVVIVVILVVSQFIKKFGGGNEKNPVGVEDDNGEIPDDVTITPTPTDTEVDVVETVTVPDLYELTEEEAIKKIQFTHKDLKYEIQVEYSDTIEKGRVIDQIPTKNALIESNETIIIIISVGKESFTLPSVVGKTESDATKTLSDLDLKVTIQHQSSDTVAENNVISMIPEEGSGVYKGDEIVLVVSTGKEYKEVSVPVLIESTESDAITKLKNAGLDIGAITYEYSSQYAEGLVKYQSYTSGQKVPEGTKVDLTVSLGPEPTATPTPSPSPSPTPDGGSSNQGDSDNTNTRYIGKVRITDSPLGDDETADIVIEVKQDGYSWNIFTGELSGDQFPRDITDVEGYSTNPGEVNMYVNGVEYENSWRITFEEVTD